MRARVLVTNRPFPETLARLRAHFDVDVNESAAPLPYDELARRAADVDAVLAFMPDRIDAALVDRCPRLRLVAAALKGADNIDAEAVRARGVRLTVVQDLLTVPTAELAVGLLLGVARRVGEGDRLVRSGAFRGWTPRLYGLGLKGSTVGLLGFGAVGRAVAFRLAPFGCRLIHHDRALSGEPAGGSQAVDLAGLFGSADAVVVALPLTDATRGIVDAGLLSLLPAHAVVVNVGRGSVVDEEAVGDALARGALGGYAADVFAFEDRSLEGRPDGVPASLSGAERTLLTLHLGSATVAARRAIEAEAADAVVSLLAWGV